MSIKKVMIFGSIIIALLILFYCIWFFFINIKYELPEIDSSLTEEELGINFSEEISTSISNNTENELKQLVESSPKNMKYLNDLRLVMKDELDEYINYLEELEINNEEIHLQKALAYVDKLQDPQLGTGRLGQISNLSINELQEVLSINENNWFAYYARGLNNLYWPIGLKRIDNAIQELAFCVSISIEYNHIDNPLWPDAYVAYGDALIKKGEIEEGIQVWKDGLNRFPNHEELLNRENLDSDQAYSLVKSERGIDSFQRPKEHITDLGILWGN
ncbi:hypothetical protein [Virgibacillus dokdonensis]|uniref:hypothetical protein n=1 Tax=Virgibacillus dokdonensis TaxID=302167 RepID=UPI00098A5606|nr:hypothetical protein [Virgibacillus dokdonensis]